MKKADNEEKMVLCNIKLPRDVHRMVVRAAKQDRRSMAAFIAIAAEEKATKMLQAEVESDAFVPPGLRKNTR